MHNEGTTPAAVVYAAWANQMLRELKAHFSPQVAQGAARLVGSAQHRHAALAQACATLESALDCVDFQLLQRRGLLGRMLGRPDPAFAMFCRQVADAVSRWEDMRVVAAASEQTRASTQASEARALLQIEMAIDDCQPQLSRVTEWLALASQETAPAGDAGAGAQLLRTATELFDHMRLAEARARHLLEQQLLLSSTRTLLADMLNTELAAAITTWEIRIGELLESAGRGSSIQARLDDFAPKHNALRRLVHKAGATCVQLRQQEEHVREAAHALPGLQASEHQAPRRIQPAHRASATAPASAANQWVTGPGSLCGRNDSPQRA